MKDELLWHSVEYLKNYLSNLDSADDLTRVFAGWLLPELCLAPTSVLAEASSRMGAARTYRDVAILGYGSVLNASMQEMSERLRDGLCWMAGRSGKIQGTLADFCTDGVAIIGIALGIRRQEDKARFESWLINTCGMGAQAPFIDSWEAALLYAAPEVAGVGALKASIDCRVLLALYRQGVLNGEPNRTDRIGVLNSLRDVGDMDKRLAILQLAAFMEVQAYSPMIELRSPSIEDVVDLLRALPNGLLRWTWEQKPKTPKSQARKWHIEHEYHFQNLLWVLLGSIFPDAKYEEYKDAVGSVHPRLDIVVPSLKLIIEVKYWRTTDPSSEMIRQIAEDASLYLTADAPYSTIIVVIWDQGQRTEQYSLLQSGLEQIAGIRAGIVVPQPSYMSG